MSEQEQSKVLELNSFSIFKKGEREKLMERSQGKLF